MENRQRIAIFIDSLQIGGAEHSLIHLLHAIDIRRYQIHLYLSNVKGTLLKDVPKEVVVKALPGMNNTNFTTYWCQRIRYSIGLRINHLRSHPLHLSEIHWKISATSFQILPTIYDVAIAYQQGLPTYFVAEKVIARRKIAWINCDIVKANYNIAFQKPFYNRFDNIVAVSDYLKSNLIDHNIAISSKIKVIYDILDIESITKHAKSPILDSNFINDNQKLCLLTVARFAPAKNHELLLRTALMLIERKIPFIWYLIGDGPTRKDIERKIQKLRLHLHVVILGPKDNPYPYIKNCDIYVCTSLHEGYGLTIAEAKILGKPIVSTNFPAIDNQITHNINGMIAEMTPKSLASRIEIMAKNHTLRQRIIGQLTATAFEQTTLNDIYRLLSER